jgi:Raf kinase inhibitor-like YbhB/YbcL family protein
MNTVNGPQASDNHWSGGMHLRNISKAVICAISLSMTAAMAQQAALVTMPMSLTSSAFPDGGIIPDKYTQASATPVSPALDWENAPAATVSFTLVVHDPDNAPQKNSEDTLHWLIFNIPRTVQSLAEGQPAIARLPNGSIQTKARLVGFMGPGAHGSVYHHYTFELFALDTLLPLGTDATRADVYKAMQGHIIAKAVDVGRFHR